MFLCLTNHQPRPQPGDTNEGEEVPKLMSMIFGPHVKLSPLPAQLIKHDMIEDEAPTDSGKKPRRTKVPPETPKDGATIYLNIEKSDVISLIPLKFGGTEIIYLAPFQSADLPEAMGGNKVKQYSQMHVLVKEPPRQVASMLGLSVIGG